MLVKCAQAGYRQDMDAISFVRIINYEPDATYIAYFTIYS